MNKIIKKLIILLIKIYQITISRVTGNRCRFYPSCSNYFIDSIQNYGLIKGIINGSFRILRCNPFNSGGYDPVRKNYAK